MYSLRSRTSQQSREPVRRGEPYSWSRYSSCRYRFKVRCRETGHQVKDQELEVILAPHRREKARVELLVTLLSQVDLEIPDQCVELRLGERVSELRGSGDDFVFA